MYTRVENNVKFSVFQQMPDNTRARRLCWDTSLQASINSTNKGDGLVETNTNTNTHAPGISVSHTNFQFRKANVQVGQVEHNYKAAINEANQPHVNTLYYGQAIPLCRVYFTRWKFNNVCDQQTHVIFITNHDTGASMWAYYCQEHHPYVNFVQPCHQVPPGPLHIETSVDMYIMCPNNVNSVVTEDVNPALAFSNYKKDSFYKELYNCTYEDYISN